MFYTITIELASGSEVEIAHGATHTSREDQCDLARGLSAGIGRAPVTVKSAYGMVEPAALVVRNVSDDVIARYIDGALVA